MNEKFREYCSELKHKIRNNKVLFINCPQFNLDTFEINVAKNRGHYTYPPTGLQYLVSSLENRNLDINILDLNYEFLKKVNVDKNFNPNNWISLLEKKLNQRHYSIIGISSLFAVDELYFIEISRYLRKKRGGIILAGGQNATYNAQKFLKRDLCDFVLERESENKINYLFDQFYNFQNNTPTPGILFKYNGKIESTDGIKDVVELKGDLIRSYASLPIEDYCKVGSLSPYSRMAGVDTPFAGILLNRGCRGRCAFCDVRDFTGWNNRSRDIKDLLNELKYLNHERGIKFFEFLDDDFTINKKKAIQTLEEIIKGDIDIKWGSINGMIASALDDELMKKMRDSGCIGFKIGVESGNSDILKKMRKSGTIKKFLDFSRIAQRFPEMFIVDNYILGFSNENFKKMKKSFNFSLEMDLDWSDYLIYQQNVSLDIYKTRETSKIKDFDPLKNFGGKKLDISERVLEGPKIFNIPDKNIPSYKQLTEICFTFNLIRDYINNKNLKQGEKSEKFINWMNIIQKKYPTNACMPMFNAIAYLLQDNNEQAIIQYNRAKKNLNDEYWKKRFKQFKLDNIMGNFPKNAKQAIEALEFLKKKSYLL